MPNPRAAVKDDDRLAVAYDLVYQRRALYRDCSGLRNGRHKRLTRLLEASHP
jgi:hypothetical protein